MIRQHDAARAEPDPVGESTGIRDQDVGRRAGDARHVVVLGVPQPVVAQPLDQRRERRRLGQRLGRCRVARHRCHVEHRQRDPEYGAGRRLGGVAERAHGVSVVRRLTTLSSDGPDGDAHPRLRVALRAAPGRPCRASARWTAVSLEARAAELAKRSIKRESKLHALDLIVRMIDLTTLEGADTPGKVAALCAKAGAPRSRRSERAGGGRRVRLPEPGRGRA